MLIFATIKIALQEISANKFRSLLTTLGIVIAVSAVVAVVSIVQGASKFMLDQVEGLGSNTMWVFRHRPPGVKGRRLGRIMLTYDDAVAIGEECPAVARSAPQVNMNGLIKFGSNASTDVEITGTTAAYHMIREHFVEEGRVFTPLDIEKNLNVCLLGVEVVKKLDAKKEDLLNKEVRIRGTRFRVVGFLEEKGSFFGRNQDELVLVPITTSFKMFGRRRKNRVTVLAQAKKGQAEKAIDQITYLLRMRHRRRLGEPNDFRIMTQDQILQMFSKMSIIVTGLTMGVVGISLLVGGIGIMNIMLVSVSERTREIGIRKALGAKNRNILSQFLIEAMALGIMGGFIGIALGMLAGRFAYEVISIWVDFPEVFTPTWAIVLAFGFSTMVGLVSGLYPAWKAAQLDPIDALRYD
ncbi:MAG: ABC transporter permease [Planctomycetota bacterium]|nr:ABC transporter permease [Planctomycetota bacterium]